MILDYSVLSINNAITVDDVLWDKRIVFLTWEKAVEAACNECERISTKYDEKGLSLINFNSK